jgi:hypothetical protein
MYTWCYVVLFFIDVMSQKFPPLVLCCFYIGMHIFFKTIFRIKPNNNLCMDGIVAALFVKDLKLLYCASELAEKMRRIHSIGVLLYVRSQFHCLKIMSPRTHHQLPKFLGGFHNTLNATNILPKSTKL